jgi:hypothetical protein
MPSQSDVYNEGASTSSATKQPEKNARPKHIPWIEKYRPQVFDEIMGNFVNSVHNCN